MTPPNRALTPPTYAAAAGWLSLILPGTGQVLLNRRWRGMLIFGMTAFLAYLVNFALASSQKIARIEIAGWVTSWLWLPFILFWLWNVLDARNLAAGRRPNTLPGIFFAAIILYVIAWNVTDVKLERLVTRFADA